MLLTARLAGLTLLAFVWIGPLPELAAVSMSAHMLLHVAVVAVVPALLRLRIDMRVGAPLLVLVVVADMIVVWGWHLPGPHLWASLDDLGFVAQQTSFLAAGLAVWILADAAGRVAAAALLMITGMHMTLIGALMTLAPTVLYPGVCGGGPFGLGPLEDQQMAGVVMAVLAPAVYWISGLVRLAPVLREGDAT